MAQRKVPSVSAAKTAGGGGDPSDEKEVYRYSASSLRLKTNEEELFELVELSEVPVDKELFKVILELLKLNVAPAAILQVLKTMRSQATQSSLPPSLQSSRASSRAHSPAPVKRGSQPQPSTLTQPDHPLTPGDTEQQLTTNPPCKVEQQSVAATRPSKERERLHAPTGTSKTERSSSKPGHSSKPSTKHAKGSKPHRTGHSKAAVQPKS